MSKFHKQLIIANSYYCKRIWTADVKNAKAAVALLERWAGSDKPVPFPLPLLLV